MGGTFGEPPQLIVRVNAPAVDGRANNAVTRAVADAFEVAASAVDIAGGATARTKTLRIHGDVERLQTRLRVLLGSNDSTQADLFTDM